MRAMILAAGRGKRMRPLTDTCPKPLLKVAGKALIVWHIEKLAAMGIRYIVINVAWLADELMKTLGDGSQYGVEIHYSMESEQGLETAGGIMKALPLLGDEPFLVVNGDVWTDFDFKSLPQFLGSNLGHLVLVNNPMHNLDGDFALDNNGMVVNDTERFTFSGVSVLSPLLFDGFNEKVLALKPVFEQAILSRQLRGQVYSGQWADVGTPERLKELDQAIRGSQ